MPVNIGIELGLSCIRAVAFDASASKPRVLAAAKEGALFNDTKDLASALKRLKKQLSINKPVYVGFPSSSSVTSTLMPLVVNPKRPDIAVEFELQQSLLYEVSQAAWHYQWIGPSDKSYAGRKALAVAVKKPILEERLLAFRMAGINVKSVSSNLLAAVNVWNLIMAVKDKNRRLGIYPEGVILHSDEHMLEWIIVSATGLHVIPVLIPGQLNPNDKKSEDHVISCLKNSRNRISEITGASGSAGSLIPSGVPVAFIGKFLTVPSLPELMQTELGCTVQQINFPVASGKRLNSSLELDETAIACGLAAQGLRKSSLSINLLEPIRSIRRASIVRKFSYLFSMLAIVSSIALLAQGMLHLISVRKNILAKISEKESTYQMLRPEIRPLIKKQAHFEERLKHLEHIVSSRMRLLDEMDIISRSLPDDAWLIKVDLSKNAYIDGLLEGYALSFEGLTHLIDELKQDSGSDAVKPLATSVTTDETSKRELISFSIQIKKEMPLPGGDKKDADSFQDEKLAQ